MIATSIINFNWIFYLIANQCESDEFYCGGRCIETERVCDGTPDCTDHSDELNCPSSPTERSVIFKKN